MTNRTLRHKRLVVAAAGLLLPLIGCGSSSEPAGATATPGAAGASRDTGSVTFRVDWPGNTAGGRYLPPQTNRLVVYVAGAEFHEPVAAILNRSPDGAPQQVTLGGIPAGLHRWISADARHVDDPALLADSVVLSPTAGQLVQGAVLAAGRLPEAVPIFSGANVNADIELRGAAVPPAHVTDAQLAIQQVIPDSFPMVLLMEAMRDQDGNPLTDLNPANLELWETVPSGEVLQAPIIDVRTADEAATTLSVSIVLDRSGSMAGGPLDDLKAAASYFVDQLSAADRAAVLSFADDPSLDQSFTSHKDLLHRAIDQLDAGGMTALLDALGWGIDIAAQQGGRAAVVGMTDGADNASSRFGAAGLTAYAEQAGIPIFTVGLRSGDYSPALLQELALNSHGLYYETPSSAQLQTIYQAVSGQLAGQGQITFVSPDPTPSPVARALRLVYHYGSFSGEVRTSYVYNGPTSTAQPLDLAGIGTISDSDPTAAGGHRYDDLSFTTTRSGWVTVRMLRTSSGSVGDPYLELYSDGSLVDSDDDSGGNLDAELSIQASPGETYVARFRTYRASDRGNYLYQVFESDVRQAGLMDKGQPHLKPAPDQTTPSRP